jgi:hypothetical protein
MKTIKKFTFTTLAALAAMLLFQTPITRAGDDSQRGDDHQQGDDNERGDQDHREAQVTFTKWVVNWPNMAGVVGGDVGNGSFTGEVLSYSPGPVTVIEAVYHFHGSKHSFTARVHVEQTGLKAVIVGVVTDGWLKGQAVEGEYTQITIDHDGGTGYQGSLEIERDSKD